MPKSRKFDIPNNENRTNLKIIWKKELRNFRCMSPFHPELVYELVLNTKIEYILYSIKLANKIDLLEYLIRVQKTGTVNVTVRWFFIIHVPFNFWYIARLDSDFVSIFLFLLFQTTQHLLLFSFVLFAYFMFYCLCAAVFFYFRTLN